MKWKGSQLPQQQSTFQSKGRNEKIDFALACRAAGAAWCPIPFFNSIAQQKFTSFDFIKFRFLLCSHSINSLHSLFIPSIPLNFIHNSFNCFIGFISLL
eukprot:UN08098